MSAKPDKLRRCAIYTRKSTEHGLELEFNSLDAQREACEAYIKSQVHDGWKALPARYLWRNVIPYMSDLGWCLAPDLVGMGQSGASPRGAYRFLDHSRYLDAWFEALDLGPNVTLVLHDWGSALGFHWAARHPERVRAIAYMESIVQPRDWEDLPSSRAPIFRDLRSEKGERMIFEENAFIEILLPKLIIRITDRD